MSNVRIPQWLLDTWKEWDELPSYMGNISFTSPFISCLDFDDDGNLIYYEKYTGLSHKVEYDENGTRIYKRYQKQNR